MHDATTDTREIEAWWQEADYNTGISCSELVVIDVDPRNGGHESLERWRRTVEPERWLPKTRTHVTGSLGWHYLFWRPPDLEVKNGPWLRGVDVKAFGGLVVGPGSIHISGRYYTVEDPSVPIAKIPAAVIETITTARSRPGAARASHRDLPSTPNILNGVEEGERDTVIFRMACREREWCRRNGYSIEEALLHVEELVLKAARNSVPPFPEDQARSKVTQAFRYWDGERVEIGECDSEGHLVVPPPSQPMKVARLVADLFGWELDSGARRLHHWHDTFYEWLTTAWEEVEDNAIRSTLYGALEDAVYDSGRNGLKPWAPAKARIGNVLDALAAHVHLSQTVVPPAWTAPSTVPPGELVSATNGLLHVPTRTLYEHTPALFNRIAVPFAFDAAAPAPVEWLRFLASVWPHEPEEIATLQEVFGYVLSGRTDLHKIFLLVGPPRAGKGVIARTLTQLVGADNVCGPTLSSLGQNFGLWPMLDKTLAVISDARLDGRSTSVVVERLLSISGEDSITVDRKHKSAWTGRLGVRLLVCTNELPHFNDASGAIGSRFVPLVMSLSWYGHEDLALEARIAAELPGILNWALEGLDRLRTNGRFTKSLASLEAMRQLQDMASPVRAFVRDECEVGPGFEVLRSDLFSAYRSWCIGQGIRPPEAEHFGRDLRAAVLGIGERRPTVGRQRIRLYTGIRLAGPSGPGGPGT
jgi:putative DNA primase/helicase